MSYARDLAVDCEEERSVLDHVEVEPVRASGEVERADERALVCEQRPVDKVGGSAML